MEKLNFTKLSEKVSGNLLYNIEYQLIDLEDSKSPEEIKKMYDEFLADMCTLFRYGIIKYDDMDYLTEYAFRLAEKLSYRYENV